MTKYAVVERIAFIFRIKKRRIMLPAMVAHKQLAEFAVS